MSTQLAVAQSSSLMPSQGDWSTMMQMADTLIKSGLAPEAIKTPQAALIIMEKSREMALPPLYGLSNIAIIKGKPVAGAELLLAVIYRDHGDNAIKVTHTDNNACTVAYKRRAWDAPQEYSFTIDDAKKAGLMNNPTWQKYPAAMLRARCISAVARLAFPDSIGGMYTPDELGADVVVTEEGAVELAQTEPTNAPAGVLAGSIGEIEAQQKQQPATKAQRQHYAEIQAALYEMDIATKDAPADIVSAELDVWIRKAEEKLQAAVDELQAANVAHEAALRDEPVEGEVVEPTGTPMEQLAAYFVEQKFPGSPHPQHVLNVLKQEGIKGAPTAENLKQCKQALERHYINTVPNGYTPTAAAYDESDLPDDDSDPFADDSD